MIINTDRSDKQGIHWCSNLDLHPKRSLAFKGLKSFFIQNDTKNNQQNTIWGSKF